MSKDDEKTAASLEMLNKRLDEVKKLKPESLAPARVHGDTSRLAIDFASATAVGTVLGYGLDQWLNSTPWGMLGGLAIGTAAGAKMMFHAEALRRKREEQNEQPSDVQASRNE